MNNEKIIYHDKDPFTGANCKDVRCPACGMWVMNLDKHARSQPDPEHAIMAVHSS
jgi:hypothetical protein